MRSNLRAALSFTGIVLAASLGSGCASAPAIVADAAEPEIQKVDRGPSSFEGELGGMNENDVASTFESLQKPILRCVADGASRVSELGGHFSVSLRIDREGNVRWAYLNESTLGDRATERCVLELARRATWPKPLSGEGLAKRRFDVDPGEAPVEWKAEKVKNVRSHLARAVAKCTHDAKPQAAKNGEKVGRFVATAYVGPNGKVKSAGVAPPSAEGEDAADCVAEAVQGLKLRSPGRRAAKVTFEI